ncbi:hypothetical protein [Arenicella xantha]|uniref:Uncharacterized protein n=1 Tax=Arenicella xantha TaxID=644221 RepID=A0A395JPE3_9GAMM|nr:hypothetical protein [Arenicella xantha]RBP51667.1 hypothetical protein DFR28_1021099 [Arenicella xantha]
MKKITLDHVERLSRGKKSGANIGSRSVGHHLRPHERTQFQRALRKGFLEISEQDRANLWHIWEKASSAQQRNFLVLIKDTEKNKGTIYLNNHVFSCDSLANAKQQVRRLAEQTETPI